MNKHTFGDVGPVVMGRNFRGTTGGVLLQNRPPLSLAGLNSCFHCLMMGSWNWTSRECSAAVWLVWAEVNFLLIIKAKLALAQAHCTGFLFLTLSPLFTNFFNCLLGTQGKACTFILFPNSSYSSPIPPYSFLPSISCSISFSVPPSSLPLLPGIV